MRKDKYRHNSFLHMHCKQSQYNLRANDHIANLIVHFGRKRNEKRKHGIHLEPGDMGYWSET